MDPIENEIDRILMHLRHLIRRRGLTQLEVQKRLKWGTSYISQLVTKQKLLRVDQLLRILEVLGVPPGEFFSEVFPPPAKPPSSPWDPPQAGWMVSPGWPYPPPPDDHPHERRLEAFCQLLVTRGLLDEEDLAEIFDQV
jgi:transcriptional regulator with XRE-family HTH domain